MGSWYDFYLISRISHFPRYDTYIYIHTKKLDTKPKAFLDEKGLK